MDAPARDALDEQARRPAPAFVTYTLIAVNLAVAFLVTGLVPTEATLSPLWWSREAMQAGEWLRLLTSMFAHGGLLHLAFNMIALFSLRGLEDQLGSARYAAIYFASGVAGGVAHVLASDIPAVGASGAIFGMLGVVLVLVPRLELSVMWIPMPAVVALSLYLSAVLLIPAFSTALPIAHWAHLGGMFAGMAASFAVNWRRGLTHLPYVVLIFLATFLLVGSLTVLDLDEVKRTYQSDGVVGVFLLTWLTWAALAAIFVLLGWLRSIDPAEVDGV